MASTNIDKQVKAFCAQIGADPLMVQGAGGNVSWKDSEVLWVKASGTWLAHAESEEIFVPVDLMSLRAAIAEQKFSATPKVLGDTSLKPSIETMLHALMPQPVVVHLHAVAILATLVREDTPELLTRLFDCTYAWTWVPYCKPGAALAEAVFAALASRPNTQVVFLQNHGVVLGGASTAELEILLRDLVAACQPALREESLHQSQAALLLPLDRPSAYTLLADEQLQQLALDPALYRHLALDWVLYPDHAVFLGPQAVCYDDMQIFLQDPLIKFEDGHRLVFVRGAGVYVTLAFSLAHYVQLRCYYEVLRRQPMHVQLKPLTSLKVTELLNWDAEKHRMSLAKKKLR